MDYKLNKKEKFLFFFFHLFHLSIKHAKKKNRQIGVVAMHGVNDVSYASKSQINPIQ